MAAKKVTKSRLFNTAKRYYDKDYYTKEDVSVFVKAGQLTASEYEEITGEKYEA